MNDVFAMEMGQKCMDTRVSWLVTGYIRMSIYALLMFGAIDCTGFAPVAVNPSGSDAMNDAGGVGGIGTTSSFVSNTPNATVVSVENSDPVITLISSNLLQRSDRDTISQRWFGEIKNIGSTINCFVNLDVSFRNSVGEIAGAFGYASANPYISFSALIPCLGPGEVGVVRGLNVVSSNVKNVKLNDVTIIEVRFGSQVEPSAVPAIQAPHVTSRIAQVSGGTGVIGTFLGVNQAISNIEIDIYPRDQNGLIIDWLSAFDLDILNPGQSFSFTTLGINIPFKDYYQFVDFLTN